MEQTDQSFLQKQKWLRILRCRKGFTLLEFLISIVIVGIVLSMLFSLNVFGIRTFVMQDSRSALQTDIRQAADLITREIRTARRVEILSANPATFNNQFTYIYTSTSGGITSILIRDSDGVRTILSDASANLTFTTAPPSRTLSFLLQGILDGSTHQISSSIAPLNIPPTETILPESGSGVAVRYQKVVPILSRSLTITSTLPNAFRGSFYTGVLTASGGTAPYSYFLNDGQLPTGVTLFTNGVLQGVPTVSGEFRFTIRVQDLSSPVKTGFRAFSVIIGEPGHTAAGILSGIGVYDDDPDHPGYVPPLYPIYQPLRGETILNLPAVPAGFAVVFEEVSSSPVVLLLNGTIIPPAGQDSVVARFRLRVINLIVPADQAVSAAFLSVLVPAGQANRPPTASNVGIVGQPTVGVNLTGTYSYADADGDPEGASVYRWIRSLGGSETVIGTSATYRLTVADTNHFIIFEVTPAAASGTTPGITQRSVGVGPVMPNHAPEAQSVFISRSGSTLTGNFTYFDREGDSPGIHQFQWFRRNGNDLDIIPGATARTFTFSNDQRNWNFCFRVTPAALTGTSPGDPVISLAFRP